MDIQGTLTWLDANGFEQVRRRGGEGAGESSVELDASALSRPGSRLEVCINDAGNPEDDNLARVSVQYLPGIHPDFARWSVRRVTGGSWESLAGGEVGLTCTRERSAVRIAIDEDGKVTVSRDASLSS